MISTGKTGENSWDTHATDIFIPTEISQKYEKAYQRKLAGDREYKKTRKERDHGKIPLDKRVFVVWDGEGPRDTAYSLLGNSEGDELCAPTLDTVSCLDFILTSAEAHPNTIHVGFGFNYDVSNIIRDLPWRHKKALQSRGRTWWNGYSLEHIPRKWFRVEKGGVHCKIFDVISFFNGSLGKVLEEWEIGPFAPSETSSVRFPLLVQGIPSAESMAILSDTEIITVFKSLRGDFLWKDMQQIRQYMRLELKYTKLLMEKLRDVFLSAGYLPTSWHGPAALSRVALGKHKVYQAMAESPYDVKLAARYAFFGGRFEQFFGGRVDQHVYCADINSAYPHYCTQLPNLSRGKWRRTSHYEPGRFAVYHVRYHAPADRHACFPLPFRDSHGNVLFPHATDGWYWSPEVENIRDNPFATIVEGFIFDEDDPTDRPFAWIADYYRARMKLKAAGNPAELTFKLIINAIYGCLAQRAGWDQKKMRAPNSHQLEWAGYITSACRAEVYRVASQLGTDLVSIDTDGVTSLRPFGTLTDSETLGGWGLDEYQDGIFWQSGIYALQKLDGTWKARMRGIERGSDLVDIMLNNLPTMQPFTVTRNNFIGYGLALQGFREDINTWEEATSEYTFGGSGKRQHFTPKGKCDPRYCQGDRHRFGLLGTHGGPRLDYRSNPHYLPWIKGAKPHQQDLFDDLTQWEESEWSRVESLVS